MIATRLYYDKPNQSIVINNKIIKSPYFEFLSFETFMFAMRSTKESTAVLTRDEAIEFATAYQHQVNTENKLSQGFKQ